GNYGGGNYGGGNYGGGNYGGGNYGGNYNPYSGSRGSGEFTGLEGFDQGQPGTYGPGYADGWGTSGPLGQDPGAPQMGRPQRTVVSQPTLGDPWSEVGGTDAFPIDDMRDI
ncbi:MAG TPA: hypothetical protein QGH10_10775, partial [Armatimonadota bacterium]|nr:hypothetical protein [Armatimonadota bacterium]